MKDFFLSCLPLSIDDVRDPKVSPSSDPEEPNTPTTTCVRSCNVPNSGCPVTWCDAEAGFPGVQNWNVPLPGPFGTGNQARKGFEGILSGSFCTIWKLNKCSWISDSNFSCSQVVPDLHNNVPWDRPWTHHVLTLAASTWLFISKVRHPQITVSGSLLFKLLGERKSFHWLAWKLILLGSGVHLGFNVLSVQGFKW